jgi:ATP-binding cassette subfamily G (WHITE) protein 2 (SNQ2)
MLRDNSELNVFRARREEAGVKQRNLGVGFENLRVVGLGAAASQQTTFGSILNPMNVVDLVRRLRHPPLRDIISGFEGVIRPGEMLREILPTMDHHPY